MKRRTQLVLQSSGDMHLTSHLERISFEIEFSFYHLSLKRPHSIKRKCPNCILVLTFFFFILRYSYWSWNAFVSSECQSHEMETIVRRSLIYDRTWLMAFNYSREQCSCLLDKPHRDMIEKNGNTMLAGEKFTDDQQCELVFGPGARICSYMPKCSRLWCSQNHKEDNGCRTQHMPWADGTKCGDGEWCQKGECVTRNRSALAPIHGSWGPWSE